jgi:hypothetical protein
MPRTAAAFPGPCSARRWAIGQHGLASHYHATPLQAAGVHQTPVPRGYPCHDPWWQGPRATHGPSSARTGTHGRPPSEQDGVMVPGLYILHRTLAARFSPLRRVSSRVIHWDIFPPVGRRLSAGVSPPLVVVDGAIPNGAFGPETRISPLRSPRCFSCGLFCQGV